VSVRKNVLLRAPLLSISGYGVHARQIFRWLEKKDVNVYVDIVPWGITSWYVNPDSLDGLVGRIMSKSVKPTEKIDVAFMLQLPNEWSRVEGAINVGMSAGVETDRANPDWVDCCNMMDAVVFPSQFSLSGIKRSGNLVKPSYVVPESFTDKILEVDSGLDLPDVDTKTNFLVVGQVTGFTPDSDRKCIFHTVKWFSEAFAGRKDVGLILKSNLGTNCVYHRHQARDLFKKLLKEVRPGTFPRVYLLNGEMSETEMASLYRSEKVSALVSLTRGEGFGLPILEAAASGLPVIATNHSAHTEFLRQGKFIGIDHKMNPVSKERVDGKIFIENAMWATPDEMDFKRRIKKFVESQQVPKEWADDLMLKIRNSHSSASIESIYDRELGSLL